MALEALPLSHSELRAWQGCHRRWYLAHYRGFALKDEPPTGVVHIGSHVHFALEAYYGHGIDAMTALKWSYDDVLRQQPESKDALLKDLDLAAAMVEGFLEWAAAEGLDAGYKVVATEHEVTYPVTLPSGTRVLFRAKLDQLVRRESDGRLLCRDYKTVGSFEKASLLLLDRQMRFYVMLLALTEPDPAKRADGALYLMMKRSKRTARATGPFYRQETITYNSHDLNATYLWAISIAEEIVRARRQLAGTLDVKRGTDHRFTCPPSPSDFCTWGCQFFQVCHMFDDGSRVEEAMASQYDIAEPYRYYDTSRIERAVSEITSR